EGVTPPTPSRARICERQSGIAGAGNAGDGRDERLPALALRGERAAAARRDAVEAAAPFTRLLDPAADDPALVFQPVEQRVQGGHVETQDALGAGRDELRELVTMSGLVLDER